MNKVEEAREWLRTCPEEEVEGAILELKAALMAVKERSDEMD